MGDRPPKFVALLHRSVTARQHLPEEVSTVTSAALDAIDR